VNRILMFAVVTVLLPATGCSAPDVRPSSAIFDELMHKSGLWVQLAQVEPMMQAGVSQAHTKSGRLSEQDLERLRKTIATTYAPDDLRTAARNELLATLPRPDAATVLRWLSSDLGKRITTLEEVGSSPDEAIKRQDTGPRILASLPAPRKQRIEHLAKLTLSAEAAADLIINTMMGVAHGLALSAPGAAADNIEDLKAKLQSQRDRFVEMLGPRIVADFAAMYQPLSDQELDQYIAFCESPAGQKYAVAALGAIDKALTEAAVRLGRQLAGSSAGLRKPPNLSLNPDASLAALTRRPLGAG
jgi:hypothetical protein